MTDRPRFDVMAHPCDQCLFGPRPLVSAARRAEIIETCSAEGTHFTCHKASLVNKDVCCRSFYNQWPYHSLAMRLAAMLDIVRFVPESDL